MPTMKIVAYRRMPLAQARPPASASCESDSIETVSSNAWYGQRTAPRGRMRFPVRRLRQADGRSFAIVAFLVIFAAANAHPTVDPPMRWLMLLLLILGLALTFTAKGAGLLALGLVLGFVGLFGLIFALAADRVSAS